jgi:outer membrane immunogenic protein
VLIHQVDGLPFVLNANETRAGWTVGVGVEYAFLSNWSAKLEYNFMEFGNRTLSFVGTESGGSLSRVAAVDQQIHVLKFGINYRFGWGKTPAPIAAKY